MNVPFKYAAVFYFLGFVLLIRNHFFRDNKEHAYARLTSFCFFHFSKEEVCQENIESIDAAFP